MTTQDSQSELRNAIEAYKRYPYGTKEYPHITGIELLEVVEAYVTTRVKEASKYQTYVYKQDHPTLDREIWGIRIAYQGKQIYGDIASSEEKANEMLKKELEALTTTTNGKGNKL